MDGVVSPAFISVVDRKKAKQADSKNNVGLMVFLS
jgi:hypothetical protein